MDDDGAEFRVVVKDWGGCRLGGMRRLLGVGLSLRLGEGRPDVGREGACCDICVCT